MLQRMFGVLAVALLLIAPAAAQTQAPAEIVAGLYAAAEPRPVYSRRLQALFDADEDRTAEGDVGALDFDWITGGQDVPRLAGLAIETTAQTASAATVEATFTNYGEARVRTFSFILEDGAWAIDDVDLAEPEKTSLSAILAAT